MPLQHTHDRPRVTKVATGRVLLARNKAAIKSTLHTLYLRDQDTFTKLPLDAHGRPLDTGACGGAAVVARFKDRPELPQERLTALSGQL